MLRLITIGLIGLASTLSINMSPAMAAFVQVSATGTLNTSEQFSLKFTYDTSTIPVFRNSTTSAVYIYHGYPFDLTVGTQRYVGSSFTLDVFNFTPDIASFGFNCSPCGDGSNFGPLNLQLSDTNGSAFADAHVPTLSELALYTNAQLNAGSRNGSATIRAVEVASIPEPSSWALIILGFGMIGRVLRRRQPINLVVEPETI